MEVTISKKLAFLLRHNAVKEGLKISPDGYVLLDEILNHKMLKSKQIYKIFWADIKSLLVRDQCNLIKYSIHCLKQR